MKSRKGHDFVKLDIKAAKIAGCMYLISEDLQHGQQLDELQIINPFFAEPG